MNDAGNIRVSTSEGIVDADKSGKTGGEEDLVLGIFVDSASEHRTQVDEESILLSMLFPILMGVDRPAVAAGHFGTGLETGSILIRFDTKVIPSRRIQQGTSSSPFSNVAFAAD